MKSVGLKFLMALSISAVAWWLWQRTTARAPLIISGFVRTEVGNKPIQGAWVVPAVYIDKSVLQLNGGYIVDYTSGCGPGVGVETDANGQFFASIPDDKIHIDSANTSTPGIAYVYALGYETVAIDPARWKSPILMKSTGVTLNDVIRESVKLTTGMCPIGFKNHTAETAMGAIIFEHKLKRFCDTPAPSIAQLDALSNYSVGECSRQNSNANARACLALSETVSAARSNSAYGPVSPANTKNICTVATAYLVEVKND
jgi:hypothetical protein